MCYKIRTSSSKIQFWIMMLKFSITIRGSPYINKNKVFPIILSTLPLHNNHTAKQKWHAVLLVFTVIQVIYLSFIKSNQSSATLLYWHYSFHYYCNYAYAKLPMFIHVLIIKPLIHKFPDVRMFYFTGMQTHENLRIMSNQNHHSFTYVGMLLN